MIEWVFNNLPLALVILGATLAVMEAFAPGAHFIVIGVALLTAGLFGLALSAAGLPLAILALVMAAVVLASGGAAMYIYREFDFYGGKGSGKTSDSRALRGKTGRVTETITTGSGEVKLDSGGFNPYYRAKSLDGQIEEGDEVMVIDPGGGNVVTVESLSAIEDDIDRELAAERRRREHERETADEDADTEAA